MIETNKNDDFINLKLNKYIGINIIFLYTLSIANIKV